ncbi:sigma-54 dependent transcriptional regulator [Prevotella sp. P2-180]|uniref:sigma-54-dependent transcriptional regulator n=1 Tax=Prevotella sp. P2-180 TaxID=2024224 RepID=UPI000B965D32|nr:sigma-54 dependent transcriptional regulator [Prevotella sp. P2-180]OYP69121.1 sigma-54-dependent Fis family transcriptional regulator [Prevotella sp. P2-180]
MKKKGNILIIDDNEAMLVSLRMLLKNVCEDVQTSTNPNAIPTLMRRKRPDVVLLDMNFGRGINNGNEGLFWLKEIKHTEPDVAVVLFTAYADIDLAVRGIKEGAADFIVKPFENEVLIEKLRVLLPSDGRLSHHDNDTQPLIPPGGGDALQELVRKVAPTDANILITGENGTGKEVLAREIHRLSKRNAKQMVTVDMGAITETLFESELFGYVRGAFTDAKSDKPGKMELAEGSTLFLDEIGNLSYPLQAKLLTALQRRTITRLGGTKEIPINIRLISATNRNLQDMVREGTFREDLLYRMNTICLHLPPLRERKDEIIPLAQQFIKKFSDFYNKTPIAIDDKTRQQLLEYPWPGNIRELEHTMERAVIIGEIGIPHSSLPSSHSSTPSASLASMERDLIARTIHECEGNLSQVAQRLEITRQTLYNKIKKYGL